MYALCWTPSLHLLTPKQASRFAVPSAWSGYCGVALTCRAQPDCMSERVYLGFFNRQGIFAEEACTGMQTWARRVPLCNDEHAAASLERQEYQALDTWRQATSSPAQQGKLGLPPSPQSLSVMSDRVPPRDSSRSVHLFSSRLAHWGADSASCSTHESYQC